MPDVPPPATPRARRIEEAVLDVDGVVAVRVWELPGRVEIGVRAAPSDAPPDVLQRVRDVVDTLREGEETWDLGLLAEG
ncbi:MAG: hypothetical protein R3A52_01790 [Polyangiales bacterium]